MEVIVEEAGVKVSALLEKARKGDEVIIVRRGKRVARLVPIGKTNRRLPDLRKFRDSISVKGDALSQVVIRGRCEERY